MAHLIREVTKPPYLSGLQPFRIRSLLLGLKPMTELVLSRGSL